VFHECTQSLFLDSNKFALTADQIKSFLQMLKVCRNINTWDLMLNAETPAAPDLKNLIDHYSEIPLQKIWDMVQEDIQGTATQRHQTDICILASLTKQAAAFTGKTCCHTSCWRVNPEAQYLDKDMANMLCCYVSTSPTY
jgi:hypothetical protein